jgi:diguanylate cyclase (GGDEF)-like protein
MEICVTERPRTFDPQEIAVARWLANQIGIAIQRSTLLAEERQRAAELEALRQASLSVTASLNLNDVLHAILESTLDLSKDALDAHIFLYDDKVLDFGAALWADRTENKVWANPRENGLTYTVARGGEMVVIPDSTKHPFYTRKPQTWDDWSGAIIGMPLKIGERVVGVMNIAYDHPREFSANELRIFRLLGDQAAVAIENARLHDLVSQQALTDPLTDLPNRRALENRIAKEFERSKRYPHGFTLMMIDLNDFKRVNDAYGHAVGDEALRQVALCMLKAIRESDFLARVGGDEFMLLLPETGKEKAAHMRDKVKQILVTCSMDWATDESPDLSLSVGMAHYPEDGKTLEELMASADKALYKEKNDAATGQ